MLHGGTLSDVRISETPSVDLSIYHRALAAATVAPEEVLFVGDNPECDFHAPRQVGMQAVLISPTPTEGVEERHRLPSIKDLPDHLLWLGAKA